MLRGAHFEAQGKRARMEDAVLVQDQMQIPATANSSTAAAVGSVYTGKHMLRTLPGTIQLTEFLKTHALLRIKQL